MSLAGTHVNVGMMTSGGLAPCLASSVAYLVEFWTAALKAGEISGLTLRMYVDGYKGVLTGDSSVVPPEAYEECKCLHDIGGSPIGNSRVKVRDGKVVGGEKIQKIQMDRKRAQRTESEPSGLNTGPLSFSTHSTLTRLQLYDNNGPWALNDALYL